MGAIPTRLMLERGRLLTDALRTRCKCLGTPALFLSEHRRNCKLPKPSVERPSQATRALPITPGISLPAWRRRQQLFELLNSPPAATAAVAAAASAADSATACASASASAPAAGDAASSRMIRTPYTKPLAFDLHPLPIPVALCSKSDRPAACTPDPLQDAKKKGSNRDRTGDLRTCNPLLYH
jgi:hypothetical protein